MRRIGIIVPTVDNAFFSKLVCTAAQKLYVQGYQAMICSSGNDAEMEKTAFRHLADIAEGILCVSGLSAFPEDLLPAGYPLVWVDRVPTSQRQIPWVANDDRAAMEQAAETLIRKGCKNILLLPGYPAEHQESPRVEGYRNALEKNGLDWNPDFVLNRKGEKSTETEAEELVMATLKRGVKIDGIITGSNRTAFGAIAGLRNVGFYAPEDVRLISFDNSPYSTMATPSITALDRKPEQLAEKACEVLLQALNGQETPIQTIVPVELVARDSTR